MTDEQVIARLRNLADEHDTEADRCYTKARRARLAAIQQTERVRGSDERRNAQFLRDLSDAIETRRDRPQEPIFDPVPGCG